MKARLEYEATDIAIDRLSDGSSALHVLTRQDVDLTVLLTAGQIRQLLSQIEVLQASEDEISDPQSKQ